MATITLHIDSELTADALAIISQHGLTASDTITAEAQAKLYSLIDETAETHKPIVITGKRNKAVLLSEEDWNAMNETIYLLSVPGMRDSIREGFKQSLSECSQELDW